MTRPPTMRGCHRRAARRGSLRNLMIATLFALLTLVGGMRSVVAQPDHFVDLTGKTQWTLQLTAPANDDGRHLAIQWSRLPVPANEVVV